MLYWLLYPVARLLLAAYYRKVRVRGLADHGVRSGATILVANHPNMLLDALALGTTFGRRVAFLAKAPLFTGPLGVLLRGVGVLPVYRPRDGADPAANVGTFDACHALLARGGALALFPEGTSHNEPHLLALRTGTARIALGALSSGARPLAIQPVGLWYSQKSRWWSDLLVVYGPPLLVKSEAGPNDHAAVRALTLEVDRALRDVTVELDTRDQERRLALVEGLYRFREDQDEDANDPEARYDFARAAAARYESWAKVAPERTAALLTQLDRYGELIGALGLLPSHAAWRAGRPWAIAIAVARLALLIVLAPVFAAGLAAGGPPALAAWWAARRMSGDEERATAALLVGALATGTWLGAVGAFAVRAHGPIGFAVLPAVPVAALFARRYAVELARLTANARLALLSSLSRDRHRALRGLQDALTKQIDALRAESGEIVDRDSAPDLSDHPEAGPDEGLGVEPPTAADTEAVAP